MREDGVCSHCETGLRSLGKRACRTAPRYAHRRFMASWPHCSLATGLRGFSPLVFSGEFHTPRLPEALQAVHRNAHPRPLGIHFHILWYRPKLITPLLVASTARLTRLLLSSDLLRVAAWVVVGLFVGSFLPEVREFILVT